MQWNFATGLPIYPQLKRLLSEAIVTGVYAPGQRLPTVRELALDAGVNPNTVQRALAELEQEGLVFAQATVGRFVTQDAARIENTKHAMALEKAKEFRAAMERLGFTEEESIHLLEEEETT